jgi:hypothetical protein
MEFKDVVPSSLDMCLYGVCSLIFADYIEGYGQEK